VGQLDQPLWQEGRSEFRAMHDAITGLPNRYLYRDRLQQSLARARRRNMLPAVMFIQLEGIRSIKDAHGDQESDQALKEIAERLAGAIRDGETLARLGFDRFALILDDLPVEQDIYTIIERLSARGTLAFDIDGRQYQVSPKIDFCLSHGACEVFDAPERVMSSRCSGCVLTSDPVDRGETA
jgi:diguanylate cyclase (GGDEF)-like protein